MQGLYALNIIMAWTWTSSDLWLQIKTLQTNQNTAWYDKHFITQLPESTKVWNNMIARQNMIS